MGSSKKKPALEVKLPPPGKDLDAFVQGRAPPSQTQGTGDQRPDTRNQALVPEHQAPGTAPAPPPSSPAGAPARGVVRRADGRELSRVAVYIDPADAKRLKLWCLKHDREMSEELAPIVTAHIRGLPE